MHSEMLIVRSNAREISIGYSKCLSKIWIGSLCLYFLVGSIWQINVVDESNDPCMHVHELFKPRYSEEVNKGPYHLMESLTLNDPNKMPLLCSRFALPKLFTHQNSSYAAQRMRCQNAKWFKLSHIILVSFNLSDTLH